MKPWYKSKTYISAIASFAVLLLNTGYSLWDSETQTFNPPTEAQIALIMGGIVGLQQTLEGRNKAQEGIGKPKPSNPPNEDAEQDIWVDWQGDYTLTALTDTFLKKQPIQSVLLGNDDIYPMKAGVSLKVVSWQKSQDSHLLINGTWYVFSPHIELLNSKGESVLTTEIPTPESPTVRKTPISLPGYTSTFYLEDPVYPGSHFYWKEALRNGTRMPYQKSQVDNIISVAKHLDRIRGILGNRPMIITSWLRPDRPVDINRQVGGVPNSRHIQGDGVDFAVNGLSLFKAQEMIKPYCQQNGLGLGLGAPKGFIHIDMAGFRMWNY